jgi:hypothetical protein
MASPLSQSISIHKLTSLEVVNNNTNQQSKLLLCDLNMTGHIPLSTVSLSNTNLSSSPILPSVPVAVIIGATSGIGEAILKQFVKSCASNSDLKPRCYLVGRNADAAARIINECKQLNSNAEVIFLKWDISLMTETEKLCNEIKKRETYLNLLVLSAGAVVLDRSSKLAFHHEFNLQLQYNSSRA